MKACQGYAGVAQDNSVHHPAPSHEGPNPNGAQRADISTMAHQLGIRLLEGISSSDRVSILTLASWRQHPKTSVEVNQGDLANQYYLLIKGTARFFFLTPRGQKVYLMWLKSGDTFGGASLLMRQSPYLVSTEVTKGSRTFVWQRDAIRSIAANFPRLLENELAIASDYLTWYVATHLCLVAKSAKQRLAYVLTTLADGIGQQCADGIHLTITNEQLANTANISIFTASRLLSDWHEHNVVIKRRSQIILRSREQLLLAA